MKYITAHPDIMAGALVIVGTRLPIAVVLSLLKQGYTVEAIHDEFPHVPLTKIAGAIDELIAGLDTDYASRIL